METLAIRQLTLDDEEAFLTGLREWDGEDPEWHTFTWKEGMSHAEHIRLLERDFRGVGLPEGRVPHTMLYGFLDGVIVGRCSVRHCLNDHLRKRGGHIGYGVAPKFRRRGFGKQLFAAGLAHLKGIGVKEALLTCAKDNLPSKKLIEGAGGKFEREFLDDVDGEASLRYWVPLGFGVL